MSSKNEGLTSVVSITSTGKPNDVADHEVDLAALNSRSISIGEVGASLSINQKQFILKRLNYDKLISLEKMPIGAIFMIEKIENLPLEEALEILADTVDKFEDDFNYPVEDFDLLSRLLASKPPDVGVQLELPSKLKETLNKGFNEEKKHLSITSEISSADDKLEAVNINTHEIIDWDLQVRLEAAIIAYHSPYPEVRAVTDPYDDPTIPCETFRAYVIGIIWLGIGSFVNQYFANRLPSIALGTDVAQIFFYPSGLLWYYVVPNLTIPLGKYSFPLSPGPWTYKEQMFATIMFSIGGGSQYVSSMIMAQRLELFYGYTWASWGFQVLLSLSTNFMGFGFAGILRRFACYPVKAIWQSVLPTIALNRALLKGETKENINGWKLSKYNFFFITFGLSFLYFWIPDYLFQALSNFNWMTWIAPQNFNLAAITGGFYGLGLNPIPTFDWNMIGTSGMVQPLYAQVANYAGSLVAFVVICGVYWTNNKWTAYLPINSNRLFNNRGGPYRVSKILNENGIFDEAKYREYGPPFYSAANLVLYGAFFAIYPFSFFYETILRWRDFLEITKGLIKSIRTFKGSGLEDLRDPHSKMMFNYKEVPDWCFIVVLVISVVLAILCAELYPTDTPVWGIFFTLALNFVFLIPITALQATTYFSFALNVLVELIIGYALPGKPTALMFLKSLGVTIDQGAQNYISDQKMAHYAKIPPRALFRGQLLAVLINCFIGLAVLNWQIDSMKDICTPRNKKKFTCPGTTTYFSSSVIWGLIGPKKVFSGLYPVMQYCFLIGFVLVFPCLAFKWYAPKKLTRYFQPSVFLGGMSNFAPYNLTYYTGSMYVGFASMWYVRSRYGAWWEKYNYILASGISAGIAFSAIIIFFAVQYHNKPITWWGNDVDYYGIDGGNGPQSLLVASVDAPDGYFGPRIGHFP